LSERLYGCEENEEKEKNARGMSNEKRSELKEMNIVSD